MPPVKLSRFRDFDSICRGVFSHFPVSLKLANIIFLIRILFTQVRAANRCHGVIRKKKKKRNTVNKDDLKKLKDNRYLLTLI